MSVKNVVPDKIYLHIHFNKRLSKYESQVVVMVVGGDGDGGDAPFLSSLKVCFFDIGQPDVIYFLKTKK